MKSLSLTFYYEVRRYFNLILKQKWGAIPTPHFRYVFSCHSIGDFPVVVIIEMVFVNIVGRDLHYPERYFVTESPFASQGNETFFQIGPHKGMYFQYHPPAFFLPHNIFQLVFYFVNDQHRSFGFSRSVAYRTDFHRVHRHFRTHPLTGNLHQAEFT